MKIDVNNSVKVSTPTSEGVSGVEEKVKDTVVPKSPISAPEESASPDGKGPLIW